MRNSLSLAFATILIPTLSGCGCDCWSGASTASEDARVAVVATSGPLVVEASEPKEESDSNWGTIRGQVVLAGAPLPPPVPLKIDKDQQCCMPGGKPVFSQKWVVNPNNKGVRWVVVYLKPGEGQKLDVHPSLKQPREPEAVLDQPNCVFTPHVLVVRKGQKLVAKNPDTVSHNVLITGLKFQDNKNLPAGQNYVWEKDLIPADYRPMKLSCGQHPWMDGYLYVLEHPYFAVTDEDGEFEIKLAPAGKQNLVIWHETGLVTERSGKPIEVKGGGVTDAGKFEVKPK